MKNAASFVNSLIILMLLLTAESLLAAKIRVAGASNFSGALKVLASQFEADSGHQVLLSFGSTGKHYAQIVNGAPFDAFFAADSRRPELLEHNSLAIADSRFTYALGKVVLWSPTPDFVDSQGQVLQQGGFRHLSIANPKLAPYGVAAQEVLQSRGLWDELSPRLVRGENIGQAYQFVSSGNAELGFVAWSQLVSTTQTTGGSYWKVPQSLYTPIEQQAVLLTGGETVRAFLLFVRSPAGVKIIREHGYDIP